MLDLKKLQKKLDDCLKNETTESLTLWLRERRSKNKLNQLGQGVIENLATEKLHLNIPSVTKPHFINHNNNDYLQCDNLLLAS